MKRLRYLAGTLLCCASAAALFAPTSAARDAARPSLEHLYSPRFELIAHCRAEEVEGRLLYQVLDVWRGKYDPAAFAPQPPQGYINVMDQPRHRKPGDEAIFFYARRSQPGSGFQRPDITIGVSDGRAAIYPRGLEDRPYVSPEYVAIGTLRWEIKSRIVSVEPPADLTGNWRMLLPGGFDQRAMIETAGENRYRLFASGRSSGIYELREGRLVAVEPKATAAEDYVWKVHGLYMLTLVEQSDKIEQDYRGAVLFRPQPTTATRTSP